MTTDTQYSLLALRTLGKAEWLLGEIVVPLRPRDSLSVITHRIPRVGQLQLKDIAQFYPDVLANLIYSYVEGEHVGNIMFTISNIGTSPQIHYLTDRKILIQTRDGIQVYDLERKVNMLSLTGIPMDIVLSPTGFTARRSNNYIIYNTKNNTYSQMPPYLDYANGTLAFMYDEKTNTFNVWKHGTLVERKSYNDYVIDDNDNNDDFLTSHTPFYHTLFDTGDYIGFLHNDGFKSDIVVYDTTAGEWREFSHGMWADLDIHLENIHYSEVKLKKVNSPSRVIVEIPVIYDEDVGPQKEYFELDLIEMSITSLAAFISQRILTTENDTYFYISDALVLSKIAKNKILAIYDMKNLPDSWFPDSLLPISAFYVAIPRIEATFVQQLNSYYPAVLSKLIAMYI